VRDIYCIEDALNELERATRSISEFETIATATTLADTLPTADSVVTNAAHVIESRRLTIAEAQESITQRVAEAYSTTGIANAVTTLDRVS
jgi:hypothetical protein